MLLQELPEGWQDLSVKERLNIARKEYNYEVPQSKLPCVYVRFDDATGIYYVGQTSNLYTRYAACDREQVVYFEIMHDRHARLRKEAELIQEFIEAQLPLYNLMRPERYTNNSV